jgi:hypothetical protein
MAGDIFISYRRADQDKAQLLYALLKQRGVNAWYDALLDAGADWRDKTARALDAAPIFVLLFSKVASESDDISKELAAATFSKKLVIPVRIENIRPSGAFLYELASRNWFDAFENTEARFEILADQLAALARGGPREEGTAFSLGSTPPAPVAKPWFRQKPVLGGLALAAVVLAALIATTVMQSKPAGIEDQRAAFFGFTAADTSELSTRIAGVATDETFAAMTGMNLQTAARGDTLGVAPNGQLDKAAALGARYAFGGNVRTTGDQITVTIQLDDSKTRATLWQATLEGGAAQRDSLPVQAAAQATNLLECLIQVRPDMVREDAGALALVTRACGFQDYALDPQAVDLWRDVLKVASRSVRAEVGVAQSYWFQSQRVSDAERPALLQEVRDASDRVLAIEPNHSGARVRNATLDIAAGRPLADILTDVDLAFRDRVRERDVTSASVRMALLSAVGRSAEAARVGRSDAASFHLNSTVQLQYGHALTNSGQIQAGLRVLQSMNRRLGNPTNWQALAIVTIFADGDIAAVVAEAPPTVSPETIACMQDVSIALRSAAAVRKAAAQRLQACLRAGHVQVWSAFPLLEQLGETEAAFAIAAQAVRRSNPLSFNSSALYLFSPASRPMRADPRFLQLVKEVGIYQYWLDTDTLPDVCETPDERDIETCRELRKDRASR